MANRMMQSSRQRAIFWDQVLKRMLWFTLAAAALFLIAYVIDFLIEYNVYESINGESVVTSSYRMPVPKEVLMIVFAFVWLAGAAIVYWYSITRHQQMLELTMSRNAAEVMVKQQLQKTIHKRYQLKFWGSMGLYTLIMVLAGVMIFIIEKSRYWYASDPMYPYLKTMKELSPYGTAVLWVIGVVVLLFRQWKKSAADTVGLINSIAQMQTDQDEIDIKVPDNLIEIKPVLQEMLSERQKSRLIAKSAEQRKNELIVYIAHDLKTPLTSVIGYLSLLVEEPQMPLEQKAEYSKIALDKALRLETLINQFFEISRYNLHEMVLEKERFDLNYLLLQLTDEFYPLLEPQKKATSLQLPDELWVDGDAGKLARVFNNILRNAVAYSKPESTIIIKASQDADQTRVAFINQGKTIPEEQLKNIFNKFFRLDEARASDTGGAGLGLAIAQEIVLLHGGTIEASTADDTVTFTVLMPRG